MRARILLIISGGIAAYKSLELIRRLRERDIAVRAIITAGGQHFVTPLSVSALTEEKVYTDLWSLTDESEMGHIRLSREADLVVVAPASADLLAKMAHGLADDLASTALLATNKPVLAAPAMNVMMWAHPATQANVQRLQDRGIAFVGPGTGDMACGETGSGRMAEPSDILDAILARLDAMAGGETGAAPVDQVVANAPLAGRRAIVTSGPTREPIDPVRYLTNQSSGKQGHAIASALARLGAEVTLVTGPVTLPDPPGVRTIHVESAAEMLDAAQTALPAAIAVCAAAVSDWTAAERAPQKLKKQDGVEGWTLSLVPTPDILAHLASHTETRPELVVGFAAETERVIEHARAKRARKHCDWIVANDVSADSGVFGGDENTVHLITDDGVEDWPRASKADVATRLAERIVRHFAAIAGEAR